MYRILALVGLGFILSSCKLETTARAFQPTLTQIDGRYVEHRSKLLNIDKRNEGFEKIRLAMIIDDSWSMVQETQAVKDAFISLTPLIRNSGLPVDIEFYRISDVNSKYTTEKKGSSLFKFTYHIPDPFSVVQFDRSKSVSSLQAQIEAALSDAEPINGFGVEQGLCFVTRFADWRKKNMNVNEKLITVVITDEDEQHGNNSSNCTEVSEGPSEQFPMLRLVYKDNQGSNFFKSAITDRLEAAGVPENQSFVFVGIIYDEYNNVCGNQEDGAHGQTYLELNARMENLGMGSAIGDVCSQSYSTMFKEKVVDKYVTHVSLSYHIAKLEQIAVITSVSLIDANGDAIELNKEDYELKKDQSGFSVSFREDMIEVLKSYQQIEIHYAAFVD